MKPRLSDRVLALWLIAIALSSMSSWMIARLRGVLDWIETLPEGRKTLATGIILALIAFIGGGLWKGLAFAISRTRLWLTARRERNTLAVLNEEAHRRQRANIGLYDHAVNAIEALASTPKLIVAALEQIERTGHKITTHADIVSRQPDLKKRRQAVANFARDLRPDVAALGRNGKQFVHEIGLLCDGWRVLLEQVHVRTIEDKRELARHRDNFRKLSKSMPVAIVGLKRRHVIMKQLTDLSPEVGRRYEKALEDFIAGFERLDAFSSQIIQIVNGRLGLLMRMWLRCELFIRHCFSRHELL